MSKIIVITGWGNIQYCMDGIIYALTTAGHEVYVFDYWEGTATEGDSPWLVTANFDVMKNRFSNYLTANDLVNTSVSIVGYSEGGAIGLYTALDLMNSDEKLIIDKYISIDTPHAGAFDRPMSQIIDNIPESSVTHDFSDKSTFMTKVYTPETVGKYFNEYLPKKNALQIYSDGDHIGRSWSTTRFKEYMILKNMTHASFPPFDIKGINDKVLMNLELSLTETLTQVGEMIFRSNEHLKKEILDVGRDNCNNLATTKDAKKYHLYIKNHIVEQSPLITKHLEDKEKASLEELKELYSLSDKKDKHLLFQKLFHDFDKQEDVSAIHNHGVTMILRHFLSLGHLQMPRSQDVVDSVVDFFK